MLKEESIQEFKALYLKEYGIELTPEDAVEKATGLFNLFKMFADMKHKKTIDNFTKQ